MNDKNSLTKKNPTIIHIGSQQFTSIYSLQQALNTTRYNTIKLIESKKQFKSIDEAKDFINNLPRNTRAKQITINGTTYPTQAKAAKALGISVYKLYYMIKSGKDLNHLGKDELQDQRYKPWY